MLVLFEKVPDSIPGYDVHTLTVDDILNKELVIKLKDYTERFESLGEDELRDYVLIQNKILNQLGAYEDDESTPPQLAYLISKEQGEAVQPPKKFKHKKGQEVIK